ncbi:MAG TPA: methyltransferase domain-containing protein, partial [Desulfobacteraceae bacterium]|nr:methyltransferase domain-containing protein [Desulfobacteraceae bacterium]
LFDQYSENFEENLIKDLEYNAYCILRQAIDALPGKKSRYDHGLDLGCGTGLAGEAFQSVCTKLSGVDLSANMIGQSAEKDLYHELHCADVIEFLDRTDQRYDLLVAADIVPYLGNLEPLFAAAAKCAAENAHFCLSSEGTEKPAWDIQPTGRYGHNPDYIDQTAGKYGWLVLERFRANIRREHDAWIRGTIFVLEKRKHSQGTL